MRSVITNSAAETERFAEELAKLLRPDDTVAYFGGLGMGKTTFTRGLAKGLGSSDEVSSPTFSLVHEYRCDPKLYHFDMYRVEGEDDLESIGYWDYLDRGICVVEWSEKIPFALPDCCLRVTIEKLPDAPDLRQITAEIVGGKDTTC